MAQKPAIEIRAGLTSASNAAADKLCPGRHLAQRGLRDPESDTAVAGTRVHEAFAKPVDDPMRQALTPFQRKTCETGCYIERMIYCWWQQEVCGLDADAVPDIPAMQRAAKREIRHWAHVRKVPVHSGQLDAYWLSPDWKHALLEDLKSLFGDVEDADTNEQLRDCAAILWENFGCETVTAYINQPNVKPNWQTVVVTQFNRAQLEQAHKEMMIRVHRSNQLDAARNPGLRQCAYCRAAGTVNCPESIKVLREGGVQDLTTGTPEMRGGWLDEIKSIEKMVKAQIAKAKELLASDADYFAGWQLGKGKKIRSIAQIASAGTILKEAYPDKFTMPHFLACCTLSVPMLEELHEKLSGLKTSEAAKAFKNLVGHLINFKETEGSLEKKKVEPPAEPDSCPF